MPKAPHRACATGPTSPPREDVKNQIAKRVIHEVLIEIAERGKSADHRAVATTAEATTTVAVPNAGETIPTRTQISVHATQEMAAQVLNHGATVAGDATRGCCDIRYGLIRVVYLLHRLFSRQTLADWAPRLPIDFEPKQRGIANLRRAR